MNMIKRRWLVRVVLMFAVVALAITFTAVAHAGGEEQASPPTTGGPPAGKHPPGRPPAGPHPGAKPFPVAVEADCIGVFAWYDGNLNGIFDGNENPLDGTSVLLMTALPEPSEDPPIGPDGEEMTPHKPAMGSPHGPPMAMGKAAMGPAYGGERPMGRPLMGPPPGAKMPQKPMPAKPFAKFEVQDRKITRDGGIAVFCDLRPGEYILQGDAPDGITYGDNRRFTTLEEGGYAIVGFGFAVLNGSPEPTNGNGA